MNVDSLSSMLDGELSLPEMDRLLRQLEQNPALREELSRLVLAREALQGTQIRKAPGFAERVMAALPDHPDARIVPLRRAVQPASAGWRPLAAGLVAAAVGGAAVLALKPETPAAQAVAASAIAADSVRTSRVVDLREYVLAHSQSRARHGVGGTLGYARYAAHAELSAAERAP
ncbi:MAG TPA: sigma-E factor negative regulatory protein [Verrucomicrobiae bacterium]|nr:sigma-E factor negative regulatory protein [Verrucomicrobiae bacterium]